MKWLPIFKSDEIREVLHLFLFFFLLFHYFGPIRLFFFCPCLPKSAWLFVSFLLFSSSLCIYIYIHVCVYNTFECIDLLDFGWGATTITATTTKREGGREWGARGHTLEFAECSGLETRSSGFANCKKDLASKGPLYISRGTFCPLLSRFFLANCCYALSWPTPPPLLVVVSNT